MHSRADTKQQSSNHAGTDCHVTSIPGRLLGDGEADYHVFLSFRTCRKIPLPKVLAVDSVAIPRLGRV